MLLVGCDPFNVSKMASNEHITVVRSGAGATSADDDLGGGDGDGVGDNEGGGVRDGDASRWHCRLWYVLTIATSFRIHNKFMRVG